VTTIGEAAGGAELLDIRERLGETLGAHHDIEEADARDVEEHPSRCEAMELAGGRRVPAFAVGADWTDELVSIVEDVEQGGLADP